jgi:superfamily II DNA or RNA helicase
MTQPAQKAERAQKVLIRLEKDDGLVSARLVDAKGQDARPDYRRFSGSAREIIREMRVIAGRGDGLPGWGGEGDEGPLRARDPEPGFIDRAADAGMLANSDLMPLRLVPGCQKVELHVERGMLGGLSARLSIAGQQAEPEGGIQAISRRHVISGTSLYAVEDLGALWAVLDELPCALEEAELSFFLSMALSRFPGLSISYLDYGVTQAPPRIARPAIIFQDIDAYGYLHIRCASFAEGFPPGMLEEGDLSRVVELDPDERSIRVRDILYPRIAEDDFRAMLAAYGSGSKTNAYEEGGRFILAPGFAEEFLSDTMPALIAGFALFKSETLAKYRLRITKPRLKLKMGSGIDFLSGSAEVEFEDASMSFQEFIKQIEEKGHIGLGDGSKCYFDPVEVKRLERLVLPAGEKTVRISAFDIPALLRDDRVQGEGEAWERSEAFYRSFNDIPKRPEPFPLEGATLRPYQAYGVKWVEHLAAYGYSGCLADEMGLGKTAQAISVLKRSYAEGETKASLVVVPKSLVSNWMRELGRFAPELACSVYYGQDRNEGVLEAPGVVVTSYATLRNDLDRFVARRYAWFVLDESQNIKNIDTLTNAAAMAIKADRRLALSGTPVENNLGELYSLFDFLNPGFFGSTSAFAKRFFRPIQEDNDEEALKDLKALVYPFMLKRTKRDVLPELPEKTEQTVLVELDAEHMEAYEEKRIELKRKVDLALETEGIKKSLIVLLSAFTELRRVASVPEEAASYEGPSAKRIYLRESLPAIAAEGHKFLVFTNHLAMVEMVGADLEELGLGYETITGATSNRAAAVDSFQNDESVKGLVMTLKTGGLGLNLTRASYIFIMDPWWNRAAEAQAMDRAHRIGQRNPVFCYRMIGKGTIEERMLELQEKKLGLVEGVSGADSAIAKRLTADDIAFLMG